MEGHRLPQGVSPHFKVILPLHELKAQVGDVVRHFLAQVEEPNPLRRCILEQRRDSAHLELLADGLVFSRLAELEHLRKPGPQRLVLDDNGVPDVRPRDVGQREVSEQGLRLGGIFLRVDDHHLPGQIAHNANEDGLALRFQAALRGKPVHPGLDHGSPEEGAKRHPEPHQQHRGELDPRPPEGDAFTLGRPDDVRILQRRLHHPPRPVALGRGAGCRGSGPRRCRGLRGAHRRTGASADFAESRAAVALRFGRSALGGRARLGRPDQIVRPLPTQR